MSVRKRSIEKDGAVIQRYFVDFRFHHASGRIERIRLDSPVNTKRGAEQYEAAVRQQLQQGTFKKDVQVEARVPTISEFVSPFLTYSENNNKPSTVEGKRVVLDLHVIPYFGKKRLDEIGLADVENFKAAMRKKVTATRARKAQPTKWAIKKRTGTGPAKMSDKSINNVLAVLRRMMSLAYEQGVISHMPKIKLFKTVKPPFDFLEFDEAERLVAAADPEWRAILLVAMKTGMRKGELLALQWSDVDLVRMQVHVRRNVWRGIEGTPKGGRTRIIDLPASVVTALRAHRRPGVTYVFSDESGSRMTPGKLAMPLKRAFRKSGISRPSCHIGWHVLRHTYGSHLAMRGVPLKIIQELMGHASIEMTMRYAHLTPKVRYDAVQVLDQPLPGPTLPVGNRWAMTGSEDKKAEQPVEIARL